MGSREVDQTRNQNSCLGSPVAFVGGLEMVGENVLNGAEGRVMRLGDSIMKSRTARKRMG